MFALESWVNPTRVTPRLSAVFTAKDDGADMATIIGICAMAAF